MRFGSRDPSEFFSQIATEMSLAWEDAVASEKNREFILLHGIVVFRDVF